MQRTRYTDQVEFLLSAATLKQLPKDIGAEVAFIGYSNVGKSSAINAIFGRKNLARSGKTPGVTQLINVFRIGCHARVSEKLEQKQVTNCHSRVSGNHEYKNQLNNTCRVLDLPGFGFAKAPLKKQTHWQHLIKEYLQKRQSLRGLFLLMDIRHPLKQLDQNLLSWAAQVDLPICVLLTKADKLKRAAANKVLKEVELALKPYASASLSVQIFSATKRMGLNQVFAQLDVWLAI